MKSETKVADIRQGETIVDLGLGAGIDVFLSANKVGKSGKVIGIDMTDEINKLTDHDLRLYIK